MENEETRIISHMLEQRSMFPGTPNTDEIPFDGTFWSKHCILKESPHVLIVPSDRRHFIQVSSQAVFLSDLPDGGKLFAIELESITQQ